MKIFKTILFILLLLGGYSLSFWSGSKVGWQEGLKSVHHVTSIDAITKQLKPVQTYGADIQIMVISPTGDVEPGVVFAHTKDGQEVLIVPQSVVRGMNDAPSQPSPQSNIHQPSQKSLTILAKS